MSGFMSGFGDAFVTTYRDSYAAATQREDDNFKLAYKRFLDDETTRKEGKKRDESLVKQAKALAELYGQPAESWTTIRDWLDAGMSPEAIGSQFKSGGKLSVESDVNSAGAAYDENTGTELSGQEDTSVDESVEPQGEVAAPGDIEMPQDATPTPEAAFPMDPSLGSPQGSTGDTEGTQTNLSASPAPDQGTANPQGAVVDSIVKKSGGTVDYQGNPSTPAQTTVQGVTGSKPATPQAANAAIKQAQTGGTNNYASSAVGAGSSQQTEAVFGGNAPRPSVDVPNPTPAATTPPKPMSALPPRQRTGLLSSLSGKFENNQPKAAPTPQPQVQMAQAQPPQGRVFDQGITSRIGQVTSMGRPQVEQIISEEYVSPPTQRDPSVRYTPATQRSEFNVNSVATLEKASINLARAKQIGDPKLIAEAETYVQAARDAVQMRAQAKATAEGIGVQGPSMASGMLMGQDGTLTRANIIRSTDGAGNPVFRNAETKEPVNPESFIQWNDEQTKILKDADDYAKQPEVVKYREALTSAPNLFRTVGTMTDIAEKNPLVLRPYVAGAARGMVGVASEIDGGLKILDDSVANDPNGYVDPSFINDLRVREQNLAQKYLGGGVVNLAEQSALFEVQKTLAAYDMAKSSGQSGNALSNKDLEQFRQAFEGGAGTIEGFKAKTSMLLRSEVSKINNARNNIGRQEQYYNELLKTRGVPIDVVKLAGPEPMELIKSQDDPAVQKAVNMMETSSSPVPSGGQMIQNAGAAQGANQPGPVKITSEEDYAKLAPGTKFIAPDGTMRTKR